MSRSPWDKNGTKRGSLPEVSFDFCYTRARDSETKSARAVCWLVAIDSQTGYIHVALLGSKNQFHLIVQELVNFSQLLGYSAISYRSHNEHTTRQILKMLINDSLQGWTLQSWGTVHFCPRTTVDRVRKLAGRFIEGLQSRLGIKKWSDHAVWTWAARHASRALNQFQSGKGATPYELVYGKSYKGLLADYGLIWSRTASRQKSSTSNQ